MSEAFVCIFTLIGEETLETRVDEVGVMHDKPELERQLEMTRGFPAINPEAWQNIRHALEAHN